MPSRLKEGGRARPPAKDDGLSSSLYYLDCRIAMPTIAMPTWPRNANFEDDMKSQSTK